MAFSIRMSGCRRENKAPASARSRRGVGFSLAIGILRTIPIFFKQWGGVQRSRLGRESNGRTYSEFPKTTRRPLLTPDDRRRALAMVQSQLETM